MGIMVLIMGDAGFISSNVAGVEALTPGLLEFRVSVFEAPLKGRVCTGFGFRIWGLGV